MAVQQKFPGFERYPDGFMLIPDIIGAKEEAELLRVFDHLEFKEFEFREWKAKRRSADFGWDYSFDNGRMTPAPPVPAFLLSLRKKAARLVGVPAHALEEVSILEYPPGSGIGWHRDVLAFDIVLGISLRSEATLRLRPWRSEKRSRKDIISIELPSRSLYMLSGSARYDWQHSVPPVEEKRYVINMRSLAW